MCFCYRAFFPLILGIWNNIVHNVAKLREDSSMLKLFADHVKGEEMYGVTVHAVLRIIESVWHDFLKSLTAEY